MLAQHTTLKVKAPFSLKATALSHGWHECAPMSWCEGGRCFQTVERVDQGIYRVSVVELTRRRGDAVTLRITVEGDALPAGVENRVRDRLRVILGVDQDLADFYELCRSHPTLYLLERIGAGRGLRSVCMAENVIKAICGTNVTWGQAVKMINRIGQLGPGLADFRNLNAWPTPREILKVGGAYLTEVCRVGYRAESILQCCRDVCEGRFDPAELDALAASDDVTSDDILAKLRSIKGIGPTSAHYLLSFLGRHDRLAIDSSTIAHVARTHTNGKRPTLKKIERIYAKYGSWRNKVWWYEHWLNWGTARQLVRDAGLNGTPRRSP